MKNKKMLVVLTISLFVLSTTGSILGASGEQSDNNENLEIEKHSLSLQKANFVKEGDYIKVNLGESEAFLSDSGKPMLPVISRTYDFPMGTRIADVNVNIQWEKHNLDSKITPTPVIVPKSVDVDPATVEERTIDEATYSSNELYPEKPFSIRYGAGLKDMEHVIFVNVKCFPQYSPVNDYINIPTKIDINIEHELTNPTQQNEDQYDLIIITHDVFEDDLQRLVTHKENMGITTKMITVDEIYQDYDSESPYDWEQIKMYLADHVLDWDTKYVLLAGGHKGQTNEWWVPDFRSHCWDPEDAYDPPYDETYSSDLYYADIFESDGSFSSWDSNDNGIYAEGPDLPSGTDQMDFYPDVHLGRIPMRYDWEADVVVDKIIEYETTADDSWFKTAVLAGGDGFPPERYGSIADPDIWEGEVVCDEFADLLANRGVVSTKCYCSDEGDIQVKESADVYNEISKGCGFVHLTGHASPNVLGSYEPGTGITPPPLIPFANIYNIIQQDNEGKLAFFINEGCHNAQFDVTTQELIDYNYDENEDFVFGRSEWLPHDQSSWMLLHKGGGAIGVIGNTALGLGGLNEGCTEFVGGWIMLRFAEAWGVKGEDYTGSVWTYGINGYIDNFDVSGDTGDRKTIEERALIGDPSVRLGGYGLLAGSDDPGNDKTEYGSVSASAPTWSVGDSWTYSLKNADIDLNPIENREISLELNAGDIELEVINVKSTTYEASISSNNIDLTIGLTFDPYIEGEEATSIPTVSLNNVDVEGIIVFDKENLGIKNIDLDLSFDVVDNLGVIEDLLQIQLPGFISILTPFMSIPANIDLTIDFDNAFEMLQFPLENEDKWEIPANTATITIDGAIKSIWLRILKFINRFVSIVPPEFAKHLPNIDISELLNDMGIDTFYEIEIPEITEPVLEESPIFWVKGSETVNTPAGSFDAVKVSVVEDNAKLYYSESEGNFVKIVGSISDYIPILDDITLELKE